MEQLFSEVLSVLVLTPGFITLYIYYTVKLRFLFILLVAPDVGT